MIRSILVALDHTPIAARVLARATELADHFDARLHLLRAIMIPPEFPAAAADAAPDDPLPDLIRGEAVARLVALAHGNARASAAPPIVEVGDPWRVIVDTADRLGVDVIVMGSHVYHWYDAVLGTTAATVANRAHRDVYVVHDVAAPPRT